MNIKISENNDYEKTTIKDIYCSEMIRLSKEDKRVYAIDADLANSIGMGSYKKEFPSRMINCGIQEANMIGVAAGLSATGLIPFVHTFAAFASRRAYDQVFVSCGFSKWNVKIVGSDPGITSAFNGATHSSFEDIGLMRNVPGITIIEASDCTMFENLLYQIKDTYGLYYIRLVRKATKKIYNTGSEFIIGQAAHLKNGVDVTIIAEGYCVAEALKASKLLEVENIKAGVIDMFTIKPIDKQAIINACLSTGAIVTAENHSIINGLGSSVAEVIGENVSVPLERVGIRDEYGEVGDIEFLAERFGITAKDIISAVFRALKHKKT